MAVYVLVHGGGHGGWCYQKVARLLRAGGHEVYTPTLTGLGERSHLLRAGIDLDLHITDVLNVITYEDLTEVILASQATATERSRRSRVRVTMVTHDEAGPVADRSQRR